MSDIALNVLCEDDTMILSENLIGSDHDLKVLTEAFAHLTREYVHIYVDARRMRLIPSGVELWIDLVNSSLLRATTIEYFGSQLADIIKYDDEYRHKRTILPED